MFWIENFDDRWIWRFSGLLIISVSGISVFACVMASPKCSYYYVRTTSGSSSIHSFGLGVRGRSKIASQHWAIPAHRWHIKNISNSLPCRRIRNDKCTRLCRTVVCMLHGIPIFLFRDCILASMHYGHERMSPATMPINIHNKILINCQRGEHQLSKHSASTQTQTTINKKILLIYKMTQ